jgi:prepilin-type processing-associated H-X9-DG protein
MYNTPENPWPQSPADFPSITGTVRAGYSQRGHGPTGRDIEWPYLNAGPFPWADPLPWNKIAQLDYRYGVDATGLILVGTGAALPAGTPLPQLKDYKRQAIMADVFSAGTRIRPAHRDNVNVLFADGSVVSVPVSTIRSELEQMDNTFNNNTTAANAAVIRIWGKFDGIMPRPGTVR